jgi:hypothetical protein
MVRVHTGTGQDHRRGLHLICHGEPYNVSTTMNRKQQPQFEIRTYVGDLHPYLQGEIDIKAVWINWQNVIQPPEGLPVPVLIAHTQIGQDERPFMEIIDSAISELMKQTHQRMVSLAIGCRKNYILHEHMVLSSEKPYWSSF